MQEALFFSQFLFVAGHETRTSLLGVGAAILARDPALLARLKAAPELLPAFVEEVLRTRPSLHRLFRVTTREVRLHGVTIPAGAPVLLLLGAANRDAERFAAGDAFTLDQDPSGQLAFGWGIHVCLGAPRGAHRLPGARRGTAAGADRRRYDQRVRLARALLERRACSR